MSKVNLAISGCMGRMGQQLVKSSRVNKNFKLTTLTENRLIKKKISRIKPSLNNENSFKNVDLIIDFTVPKCTFEILKIASKLKKRVVIGTTGFTKKEENLIKKFSKKIPILKAGNMSLGINLLMYLTEIASKSLGSDFLSKVYEVHHKHKIDYPSGTALMLGDSIANGRNQKLDKLKVISKVGNRKKTKKGKITFNSFRKGNVIGDHKIIFSSKDEVIELSHEALDRGIFATGAIQAALWGINKKAGLFSMIDVLGK